MTDRLERFGEGAFEGKCWVCSRKRTFLYDRNYSDGIHVNWRERLVCPRCGLNNRLRLCVQVIERMAPKRASMYLTEQVTPLAACLSRRYARLIKSEFLGDGHLPGSVDARGIRHEDVTVLSFGSNLFDCVLSFDVLEHVPDYRKALAEFRRVLKVGGTLILSVPFGLLTENNVVRARIAPDGSVEHLLPPEYHGDPVDPQGGILCYYHFGWELLEDLKAAGFGTARVDVYWSSEYGHIGDMQPIIIATK
ncbi:MAG: class I SAM-dependent methyltransferase [Rhodanobacter sp.]|nr:MAG: class I SAM-dependent methyltransferase [Rhodanobacter sp.]